MTLTIDEEGSVVTGEIKLLLPPGTLRADQQRALDEALGGMLDEAARALGVVVSAAPYAFARPIPGRGADGSVAFKVRGRAEGDRLIPALDA